MRLEDDSWIGREVAAFTVRLNHNGCLGMLACAVVPRESRSREAKARQGEGGAVSALQ